MNDKVVKAIPKESIKFVFTFARVNRFTVQQAKSHINTYFDANKCGFDTNDI